jgi:formylmethanofuran dehydrogenase subunit E
MRGKQAFSFYNRNTGKSVRLVQKNSEYERTRDEAFRFYSSCSNEEMFDVMETAVELPEAAKIFESYACECCGEKQDRAGSGYLTEKRYVWTAGVNMTD